MNLTKSFQTYNRTWKAVRDANSCLQGPKNLSCAKGPYPYTRKIKFMLNHGSKVTESVKHTSTRIVRFVTQRFSMTLFSVPSVSTHHVTCIQSPSISQLFSRVMIGYNTFPKYLISDQKKLYYINDRKTRTHVHGREHVTLRNRFHKIMFYIRIFITYLLQS